MSSFSQRNAVFQRFASPMVASRPSRSSETVECKKQSQHATKGAEQPNLARISAPVCLLNCCRWSCLSGHHRRNFSHVRPSIVQGLECVRSRINKNMRVACFTKYWLPSFSLHSIHTFRRAAGTISQVPTRRWQIVRPRCRLTAIATVLCQRRR